MSNAVSVTLSDGTGTLIDACDLRLLDWGTWCKTPSGYVLIALYAPHPHNSKVQLSRAIMDAPAHLVIDHINHDTLDNRRENLRLVTRSQNLQNRRGAARNSHTGIRGVHRTRNGTFAVQVNHQHVGRRATLHEAEQLAKEARRRMMTHSAECDAPGSVEELRAQLATRKANT